MQKAVFAFNCKNCGKKWRDSKPANHEMDECPFCGSADIDSEKVGSMGFYAVDECPVTEFIKQLPKDKKEKPSKLERKKKREELREKKREGTLKKNERRSQK